MHKSYLQTSDLTNIEPMLADYYRTSQTDYATMLIQANDVLEMELRNRRLKLKNLETTLTLTDATKSNADEVGRTRLVLVVSAVTGTATFALQGTDDTTSETWTDITVSPTMSVTSTGTTYYKFYDTYDYYKLTKTGTVTYTAFLVERSFELVLAYLTISMIFRSLQALVSDMWEDKAKFYWDLYQDALERAVYSYDANEDGIADEDEVQISRVGFRR